MKILTLTLFSLLFSQNIFSYDSFGPCKNSQTLESLPILQSGRVKPLYVHANESLKYLFGKTKLDNKSYVETYCHLSFSFLSKSINNSTYPLNLTFSIEHIKLQKFLGDKKSITYSEAIEIKDKIRKEVMLQKEPSSYKKSLEKLFSKLNFTSDIISGRNWKVYKPEADQTPEWISITALMAHHKFAQNNEINDSDKIMASIQSTGQIYTQNKSDKHLFELKFSKLKLFFWGIFLAIISLGITIVSRNKLVYLTATISVIALQVIAIIMRIMISGRAPITNMYETVMFSGFGALVLSHIMYLFKKDKMFLIIGLAYNIITLFMINFAHSMLSESISPLVPVLKDNFWLSTHVTCIILSYSALALSWVLSNYVLFKGRFSVISSKDYKYYGDLIYTCLKFGTVLLAAGIILGGVWADYSWGRYWGWDPKETWSLIVLCIYIVILHGRYTNWIGPKRFVPLTAGAFLSVMMAWFGVNYILASGLHSYGFSQGGAFFLGTFFITQLAFIALTTIKIPKSNV